MRERRINGMVWSQNKITGQWSGSSKSLTAWCRVDPQLGRWTVTCENLNIRQHILPGNMVDVPVTATRYLRNQARQYLDDLMDGIRSCVEFENGAKICAIPSDVGPLRGHVGNFLCDDFGTFDALHDDRA